MGALRFSVHTEGLDALAARMNMACSEAEHIVAVQIRKDTSPYVPFLTGSLDNRTKVDGKYIIYPGPYARFLYNGVVMVDSATGKGPSRYVDKKGNEFIRFKKGATLIPTDRPLKFNKSGHRLAQARWLEASKAQNLDKWIRVAGKAVAYGTS